MEKYLCIDIGGTKIKYGLFNKEAISLSHVESVDTPYGSKILDTVLGLINEHFHEGLVGIAISSAGVINPGTGEVVYAGPTIPNYIGVNFYDGIKEKFDIPVSIENDVNAALLGEYWKGSAQSSSSTVMLTVGTGVGGAFMIKDTLWNGFSLSAGEVGYLGVGQSYFQSVASSSSLSVEVSNLLGYQVDGREIFRLANEGNLQCIDSISKFVHSLCLGMSDIMYLLNPETIILGGGIMDQREYLSPLIHKALDEILIDSRFKSSRIEFATCGNDAGMIGALYHLLYGKQV